MTLARILTDVDVRISPRVNAEGKVFTELHHSWTEGGQRRFALSRVAYAIPDTKHSKAAQIEAFKKRQARAH
ncbi:hypothetical protein [Rhodopseudomonas palustris]|uniref:hypothetical protein n=1 Tax=Rhodopseudomonas palustris TaxID=1076 RepID=UPI000641BFAD|nr:hypothetical protein [Rhodopseudomonas palustris]